MLRSYYEHVCRYKSTLLTRFYGTHCIKQAGCPKVTNIQLKNYSFLFHLYANDLDNDTVST
jgi:1-phosphatidylinositol-4-phosphate 5-kinase